MKAARLLILLLCLAGAAQAQPPGSDAKVKELERKLDDTTRRVEQLVETVETLRAEVARLKGERARGGEVSSPPPAWSDGEAQTASASRQREPDDPTADFTERIVEPELGGDERDAVLAPRPEIFVQTRYSALPVRGSGSEFEPNLSLTRIETRWSGRVSERLGAGVEIQFHPALDGAPEELVNDAFVEYYLNDHATVRVGQFVKPFGFEIQQSSSVRESPERGIFAGYFFPGQRDRGVALMGDLDFLDTPALKNVRYHLGAFNGNRFFADNNRQPNYLARVRKLFPRQKLALGVSVQHGKQILPAGVAGDNDENLVGFDFQYAVARFGVRGEIVRGDTPSTLLAIEPEFAPAFRPGARSSGGYLFATYHVTPRDDVYARYDGFNNDPVTGRNVRAFNFGYFRQVGGRSRLGFDYQFKNRPSFNDDAVNGRLNITWGIEF